MYRFVALFPFLTFLALAAEEAEAHAEPSITYKWINFGILAVALLYLIVKYLLPVLKARAGSIEKDLAESKATVQKAEAKVAELTAKLGNFEGELRSIRERAQAERESEGKRISEQTQTFIAKVAAQRETEIGNLTQVAQSQLRAFTIEKAIEIAHTRLAQQTDPATQSALVQSFVNDLKQQEAR
jgi:F0F1-type ATP synthase membrane subunit b/b'